MTSSCRPATTRRPPLAGASGAIWGIQMSLFAWLFAHRRTLPADLAADWFRRLCVVFVLNAGVSFLPGISWAGHLGGGVAGFIAAGLLTAARHGPRAGRGGAWLLLALLPLACVGGVVAAMDPKGIPGWQRLHERLADKQAATVAAEQRKRLRAAETKFEDKVAPRLAELNPNAVRPAEADIGLLLTRSKRSPERVAAAEAQVRGLKDAADAVQAHTPRAPTGGAAFDQHCERVRAFAAARARAFDLLLAMLADDGPPPVDVWAAWQAARDDADRIWAALAGASP